jgi:hypothetical protein
MCGVKITIMFAADNKNIIDWNDDADLGEVQLTIGDTVITEKGIADKDRSYLPKDLVDRFDGHNLWFKITEDEANNTYRSVEEIL